MGRIYDVNGLFLEQCRETFVIYIPLGARRIELPNTASPGLLGTLIVAQHAHQEHLRAGQVADMPLVWTEVQPDCEWTAPCGDGRLAVIARSHDRLDWPYRCWIAQDQRMGADAEPSRIPISQPEFSYTWAGAVARCVDMAIRLALLTGETA